MRLGTAREIIAVESEFVNLGLIKIPMEARVLGESYSATEEQIIADASEAAGFVRWVLDAVISARSDYTAAVMRWTDRAKRTLALIEEEEQTGA
jgi:hypothetical protein